MRMLNRLIDRFRNFDIQERILILKLDLFEKLALHLSRAQQNDIQERILKIKLNLFEKLSLHLSQAQQKMCPSLRLNFLISSRDQLLSCLEKKDWHLIPSLVKRDAPIKNNWRYQNENLKWNFNSDMKVLDVGSGGYPFNFATHLADKYTEATSHRTEKVVKDDRPFFQVDIEDLPFKVNEYDFVFCSHVLEHLDCPGDAMRELMRIGSSGYIEIPTRMSDIIFNFTFLENHHKWHGLILNNTVILTEWSDSERKKYSHQMFNAIHSEYENEMQSFFDENRKIFFHSFVWEDSFDFIVIDKNGRIIDSTNGVMI